MERRRFLKMLGLSPLVLSPARALWASAADGGGSPRTLVLVELEGGNDGLNAIVPYRDSEYYALRPTLAVSRDDWSAAAGRRD